MTLDRIRLLLLTAAARWRALAYGFEDEDDVARMVAREFGEVGLFVGGRG